jgi:hypothetical protein
MKKIAILICCLFPFISFAKSTQHDHATVAAYQELCAKEKDPVKRNKYCYLLHHSILDNFKKETEIA